MDLIVAVRAGTAYAGSYDLRKSVDIKCLKTDSGLDLVLHLVCPCLCAEDTAAQVQFTLVDAGSFELVSNMQSVCRCAHQHFRLPLTKDPDLSCSITAGYRDSNGTELLACIVGSETSCEQSVAVSDMNEVTLLHA